MLRNFLPLAVSGVLLMSGLCFAQETPKEPVTIKISTQPMNNGTISPMIYGGFVELLDDLAVGMWSEMLNDRHFDGIVRASDFCYYNGEPTTCDRPWDVNSTWIIDTDTYHSAQSARLMVSKDKPASLTQSGLTTKKGFSYQFKGWFKTDNPGIEVEVTLRTKIPDDSWLTLASKKFTVKDAKWTKLSCDLPSCGNTEQAVFELEAKGQGNVWVDEVSLMPSDNKNGWRPDVIEAVKEANPTQLRWGGCFVDPGAYQWKNGIGDRDLRVGFQQCPWGRVDPMDIGIDEFLQFCEYTKTIPLVCISFGDTVQSAVDLMEYCNGSVNTTWGKKRAENGHPKPYNVKYWQLGNELGDSEYVAKAVDFGKAMKAYDPNAIILSSFPSAKLIDKAGQYLDYLCPHHYTTDLKGCAFDIENIKKNGIDTKMQGRNVKVGITEWNTTGGDWGINRGKLMTLYCALQNAEYLNMLQRHADTVGLANRSNLVNSYGSGMIVTKQGGLYKNPSFYVMKLYADHSKPVPVTVSGTSPEGIDISACKSKDGKSLCIFAVNTTTEPVEINLDLNEFGSSFTPIGGGVVCDTIDGKQPELMNHWSNPERVKIVDFVANGGKVVLPAYSASAIECAAKK